METDEKVTHWTDKIIDEATTKFGGKHVIMGGWSPSGIFHIGNSREIITANAINRKLKDLGITSNFVFVIDDFDGLEKIPSTLKKYKGSLKEYIGHPLCRVPDPTKQFASYSELFASSLKAACKEWNIDVEFLNASDLYKEGKYDKFYSLYLQNYQKVQEILKDVSGSELSSFLIVICPNCGSNKSTEVLKMDDTKISIKCQTSGQYKGCNTTSEVSVESHEWKLKWRLDWPARQTFCGVTIEPAGKDHSVEGGSIDTSIAIHREILNHQPPVMPRYGFITINGKKMSGSSGLGLPVEKLSEIVDPSSYLYLVYKTNLTRDVDFDYKSMNLLNLIDEYIGIWRDELFGDKYEGTTQQVTKLKAAFLLTKTPYHEKNNPLYIKMTELLLLYQISLENWDRLLDKLKSLGKLEEDISLEELSLRLKRAMNWLNTYGPDNLKFKINEIPPEGVNKYWTKTYKDIWLETLNTLDKNSTKDDISTILRAKANEKQVQPKELFKPFYQLIISKDRGPNASQLIVSLGSETVLKLISKIEV